MADDPIARGGPAADWLSLFQADGAEDRLIAALQLPADNAGAAEVMVAIANDLGLAAAEIVAMPAAAPSKPRQGQEERAPDLARQWQFAAEGERGRPALILPVAPDYGRPAYDPGQVTLSVHRLSEDLFLDSICDLVALPLDGGLPLSLTGLCLAVGRFAVRERGEVEIYAGGLSWLQAHLARGIEMEAAWPSHLVVQQLEQPEHFCTLLLEPKAIEWRPAMAWCPLPRETKSVVVRDSSGLAGFIHAALRRKQKTPPLPHVYGPKVGAA